MRDIGVAVVLYNNENEVIQFAMGLLRQSVIDRIQLLVTCNACKDIDKFKRELAEIMPSALVFDPHDNLGYLNGCLFGVKESKKTYSWVMISNTDIELKEKDFFEKALENTPKDVWCIGPDIMLSSTGVHQNPFLQHRPSKKKIQTWKIAYSNYIFFWLYFKLSTLKSKSVQNEMQKSGIVYSVHGSCFLLRNECVNKIITDAKGIFMYGEELLVAEVVRQNNKKILFSLSIGIIHNENQVTGTIVLKRKQKWFKNSIEYLAKDFFNYKEAKD